MPRRPRGFGLQRRAARVDQPPARRKQRPGRAQQLQLPGRERRDVFRPPQQLDVRMPPDHAGRRARHVEQDPLEGSRRPTSRRARPHRRPPASPTSPSRRRLSATRVRRSEETSTATSSRKFRLQLQQVAGLAARRRAGIEHALAGPRRDQIARRAARRRPGSTRRPRRSPAAPRRRWRRSSSSASSSNMLSATAMPLAARRCPILRHRSCAVD